MKLGVMAHQSFGVCLDKLINAKGIPIATLFKLKSIASLVLKEVENYRSTYKQIVEQHAKRDEDGKIMPHYDNEGKEIGIQIPIEAIQDFNKQVEELYNIEIEISEISINSLGDYNELTAKDLLVLDFIKE